MKIADFFIDIGVNADTPKINDFVVAIGKLPITTAVAITALLGLEYQFSKLVASAISGAVEFQKFETQTGLSSQELQKWQIAAEQANVSAETVAASISALERNIAEIRLGRGNIAPFQILGITVNQDSFQILEQLRSRIQMIPRPMATNLISQMGLSPDMMQVLEMSEEKFRSLQKTVKGMSEDQKASFLEAKLALSQFGLELKQVAMIMGSNLINGLSLLINKLGNLKDILPYVGAAVLSLGITFFPVTTAILGLLLLLDDLAVYFLGGNSVIGLAIEGFKKLASIKFESLTNLIKDINNIGDTVIAKLATVIAQVVYDPKNTAAKVGSAVAAPIAPASETVKDITAKVLAEAMPYILKMSNSDGQNKNITQNVNITVNGSKSAEETANAIDKKLKKQINDASLQTNNQER